MLRPRRASRAAGGLDDSLGPDWRGYALLLALFVTWMVTRGVLVQQVQHAAVVQETRHGTLSIPESKLDAAVASTKRTVERNSGDSRSVHVVLTSNGNPYMNWQTRVFYATYKRVVAQDLGGVMARGAFTRVLHRSTDDELMQEVPTWRITPVHVNCDVYCSFPVADRAPALLEWLRTPDSQRCSHILLVETDYVFIRPLPASILPARGRALGFPYSYIIPQFPTVVPFAQKFYPDGPLSDIPATGNAPMLLAREDFERILPVWSDFVAQIEADDGAVDTLGWVRDMYAWSFAAAKVKLPHDLPAPPNSPLMVQPPADTQTGEAAILHYTWVRAIVGTVVKPPALSPRFIYFVNRDPKSTTLQMHWFGSLTSAPTRTDRLEKIPEPPAFEEGLHLQSFFAIGNAITPSGLEVMRQLVHAFNDAVDSLPELPEGYTDRASAERAALPSPAAQELADRVQREIAMKEAKKKEIPQ